MEPSRISLDQDGLRNLKPGSVIMHKRQYNKLCEAEVIRVRTMTGRKPEFFWNGAPVYIDDGMPPDGWFIVPGGGASSETIVERVIDRAKDDE